jgi:hypothetical protein
MDGASMTVVSPAAIPPFFAFFTRERQLKDFSKGLISNSLRLLVAISGLLSTEDHETLCALLWQRCLTQVASEIQTSVCTRFWRCSNHQFRIDHYDRQLF